MKILLIDNYDSFTYNLWHLLKKLTESSDQIDLIKNDQCGFEDADVYDTLIISPGSGIPKEAGNILSLIRHFAPKKSILGICLGHQAIAEAFGGELYQMDQALHGMRTPVKLDTASRIFEKMPNEVYVGRYHSWCVRTQSFPKVLKTIAWDDAKQVMAISHTLYNVYGLQFHPESFMTEKGEQILRNFLKLSR